jgi:predicted transcriptional regulator
MVTGNSKEIFRVRVDNFGVWVLGFKIFAKFSTTENFDINPVKELKTSSAQPTGRRLISLQRGRTPTD